MIEVFRGDVVEICLDPVVGREIGKTRPAVVVQNDIGNRYSPLVIVAPIRGAEHIKRIYPVVVQVEKGDGGLKKKSVVQCDQLKSLDKSRIKAKSGRFSKETMEKVDAALKISLALT